MTIPRALAQSLRLQPGDIMEGFIERGDLVFRIQN
jgi:antitoxin component of MazEF toxin-antitoxin module